MSELRRLVEEAERKAATLQVRSDEQQFYEDFLPGCIHWKTGKQVELYPYQRSILADVFDKKRVLLHWGRQCGKSFLAALYAAFMVSTKPNQTILICSFREEQSKYDLRMVKRLLQQHEKRNYGQNIEFSSAKRLTFRNGSRIEALSSGQVARGFTADVIILDESELVDDEDMSAWLPTKIATTAFQMHLGTSSSLENFWTRWTAKPEDFGFSYSRILSTEALVPYGPVTEKGLAELKQELDEAQFSQECLLIPISSEYRFWPPELVERIFTDSPVPSIGEGWQVSFGIDPAVSSRDESVLKILAVLPDGSVEELETIAVKRTPLPGFVDIVREKYIHYQALSPLIVFDETSAFGITFGELLKAADLPSTGYKFSSESKMLLYSNGKTQLEKYPARLRDPATRKQLLLYHFKESETTKGRFKLGRPGFPDDRSDALMLALWGVADAHRRGTGEFSAIPGEGYDPFHQHGSLIIPGTGQYSGQKPMY